MPKNMTLEDFENNYQQHSPLVAGKWITLLRAIEPRTPTLIDLNGSKAGNARASIISAWQGNNAKSKTSVRKERGGIIRTTIIDDELWVVWYPEEK